MPEPGTDIRMCIGFQNSISGLTKKLILTSLVRWLITVFTFLYLQLWLMRDWCSWTCYCQGFHLDIAVTCYYPHRVDFYVLTLSSLHCTCCETADKKRFCSRSDLGPAKSYLGSGVHRTEQFDKPGVQLGLGFGCWLDKSAWLVLLLMYILT